VASIFRKKAQRLEDAKMVIMRAAAMATPELRPLIDMISRDIWDKNYKMAEARCRKHADELDKCAEVVDLLCEILPDYAVFVEIRRKNNEI
jgi:hypothetical protein